MALHLHYSGLLKESPLAQWLHFRAPVSEGHGVQPRMRTPFFETCVQLYFLFPIIFSLTIIQTLSWQC